MIWNANLLNSMSTDLLSSVGFANASVDCYMPCTRREEVLGLLRQTGQNADRVLS